MMHFHTHGVRLEFEDVASRMHGTNETAMMRVAICRLHPVQSPRP
ncbi:hypothetical protein [Reticulibacter mediterranei]|nr:hypothetical protein [Reticulibacter mediterranei]